MSNYEKLEVWIKSKNLTIEIYKLIAANEKLKRDFGLKDQIQRSAVSIPSNIAEGDELDTVKQSLKHFYIAKGSCAELRTQLIIAKEIGYLKHEIADPLIEKCRVISASLHRLIEARKKWIK